MKKLASGSMTTLYYPKKRGYNVNAELNKIDKELRAKLPHRYGFVPLTPGMVKTQYGWLCKETGIEVRVVEDTK